MKQLKYLIEKEFKQIKRNSFMPRLILLFPCMIMLIMPWAATMEIENLRVAVVDADHSPSSHRLIHKIEASRYFNLVALPSTYNEGLELVKKNQTDVMLEIPRGFEKTSVNGKMSEALVAVNSVDGMKGALGSSYLAQVLNPLPKENGSSLFLFNQNLNYKIFMIPALLVMLLVLMCGFLPALNVVGEKEAGTIEQMNVSPVSRFTFILSKLIPYWIMGIIVFSIGIFIAWALYELYPAGSLCTIYLGVWVFILVVSGFGLVVSNYSDTMQQAMFVMWFCILVFILMSGLFTPISSMPYWAQYVTYINPLRYFMEVMRMVYLKGSSIVDVLPRLGILACFALIFYAWAIKSYQKQK